MVLTVGEVQENANMTSTSTVTEDFKKLFISKNLWKYNPKNIEIS
jgi:hypothetical protein